MVTSVPRRLAQLIAVGRIGIGCTALVAPTLMTRPWIGDGAGSADARLLARTMGGRDLALGLGTLRALGVDGAEARPWVALAGMADAIDAAVTIAAWRPPAPADPVGHPGLHRRGRPGLVPGGRGMEPTPAIRCDPSGSTSDRPPDPGRNGPVQGPR